LLLRLSGAETGADVSLEAVGVGATADPGVLHGRALVEFSDAVLAGDDAALGEARGRLQATIGAAGTVDAAAVVAMFSFNDRVADATGTPIDRVGYKMRQAIAEEIGIREYVEPSG